MSVSFWFRPDDRHDAKLCSVGQACPSRQPTVVRRSGRSKRHQPPASLGTERARATNPASDVGSHRLRTERRRNRCENCDRSIGPCQQGQNVLDADFDHELQDCYRSSIVTDRPSTPQLPRDSLMRAAATRPPVAGAWRPRQASPRGQVLDSGGAGREGRPGPVVHRCHRDRASESFREGRRQARARARRDPLGTVRERRVAEDVRSRPNTTAPPSPPFGAHGADPPFRVDVVGKVFPRTGVQRYNAAPAEGSAE